MNRVVSIIVLLCSSLFAFSGGTGTALDPYQISTPADVKAIPNATNKYLILTNDITMDGEQYYIDSYTFSGTLDGQGYKIHNVNIQSSNAGIKSGFIPKIGTSGVVKNLSLMNYHAIYNSLGGIAYENNGLISHCYVQGLLEPWDSENGGLVGFNNSSGTIENSACDIIIDKYGSRNAGFVGRNQGTIRNCYATGTVLPSPSSSYADASGFVAINIDSGTIENCYSSCYVPDTYFGGSFCCTNYETIRNCFWDYDVCEEHDDNDGGSGKTTTAMKTLSTFTSAGWDFVDETENGIDNPWQIINGMTYPLLVGVGPQVPDCIGISITGSDTVQGFGDAQFTCVGDYGDSGTSDISEQVQWSVDTDCTIDAGLLSYPAGEYHTITIAVSYKDFTTQKQIIYLPYLSGQGTEESPYEIHDATSLATIAASPELLASEFVLVNDLDLSGIDFTPIGNLTAPFSGVFNGDGFTISNLTIDQDATQNSGLFGYVTDRGLIENINISVAISNSKSDSNCGAIVGTLATATIKNCTSTGNVNGSNFVGGIAGKIETNALVTSCFSDATIIANGAYSNAGGVVGRCYGEIKNSVASSTITASGGHKDAGGVVGTIYSGSMHNCYAESDVTSIGGTSGGTCDVGGLAGYFSSATVSNCYANSIVTLISSSYRKGGFVAGSTGTNVISGCFWNTDKGLSSGSYNSLAGITALDTSEMKNSEIFQNAGWDIAGESDNGTEDIWHITNLADYPRLQVGTQATEIESLELTVDESLFENETISMTLIATFENGAIVDVTSIAQWESDNAAGQFNTPGTLTALEVTGDQTVNITAQYGGLIAEDATDIIDIIPTSISITGSDSIPVGQNVQYQCLVTYNNETQSSITSGPDWSIGDAISTITLQGLLNGVATIGNESVTISCSYMGLETTKSVTITNPRQAIEITGASELNETTTTPLSCKLIYASGSEIDITSSTTWSDNSDSVSINSSGVASAQHVQADTSATVTATYETFSDNHNITIVDTMLRIEVSGTSSFNENTTSQLTCKLIHKDGSQDDITSQVVWSDNSEDITVSNGLVSSGYVSEDTPFTITASYPNQDAVTYDMTIINYIIGLEITGVDTINEDSQTQLTCNLVYNDGTKENITSQASWSDNSEYITISNGLVSSEYTNADTPFTITVSYPNQESVTYNMTLANNMVSIEITGAETVNENSQTQLTCNLVYNDGTKEDITSQVKWSTNREFITISSDGLISSGYVDEDRSFDITATFPKEDTAKSYLMRWKYMTIVNNIIGIEVAGSETINENSETQLTCNLVYSNDTREDITSQVSWIENSSIISINESGLLSSGLVHSNSTVTIGATYLDFTMATHNITIENNITGIEITGQASINEDTETQLTCNLVYSDGTREDITSQVTFSGSSDYATVDTDGYVTAGIVSTDQTMTINASWEIETTSFDITIADYYLSLEIEGPASLDTSGSYNYECFIVCKDESRLDVSSEATFSENSDYLTIGTGGSIDFTKPNISETATLTATIYDLSKILNISLIGNRELFEGGEGTWSNPYQIGSIEALEAINLFPDDDFILVSDIDLSSKVYDKAVIAYNTGSEAFEGTAFSGSLRGDSYVISNLTIITTEASSYVAFIGLLGSAGNVQDILLENCNITVDAGSNMTAGFCAYNSGYISGCGVEGTVNGDSKVAGFCGESINYIRNSFAQVDVTGTDSLSNFMVINRGSIWYCYSAPTVGTNSSNDGFLRTDYTGDVHNCIYKSNNISANNTYIAAKTEAEMKIANTFNSLEWHAQQQSAYVNESWILPADSYPTFPWRIFGKVEVPQLTGISWSQAYTEIQNSHLYYNGGEYVFSDTIAKGTVISQSIVAGTMVMPPSGIRLVTSKGPEFVDVPNIVGLTRDAAVSVLVELTLVAGYVFEEYSETVEAGKIISQNYTAGTTVNNGTSVGFVVSKGSEYVTIPDLSGTNRDYALYMIDYLGLELLSEFQEYSDFDTGLVVRLNESAGARVKIGSSVVLYISQGKFITVPNCVGMYKTSAFNSVTYAGLQNGGYTEQYSNIHNSGCVISQSPDAGEKVIPGTYVTMVVSKGKEPVSVPDVTGMTEEQAIAAIEAAGFVASSDTYYSEEPVGKVYYQYPEGGSLAVPGSYVDIEISEGVPSYSGGSGTEQDPFLIDGIMDLATMSSVDMHYDKCFKLISDIDLSPYELEGTIIGYIDLEDEYEFLFDGIFDGNGHSITGLNFLGEYEYGVMGLFAGLDPNGIIRNLNITGASAQNRGNDSYIGVLAVINKGTIQNCHIQFEATDTSTYSTFAPISTANYGTISTCTTDINISGNTESYIAGICADSEGIISLCRSTGNITTTENAESSCIGGIAIYNSGTISQSISDINITTNASCIAGSVVAVNSGGIVDQCCYNGNISCGPESYCGGFAGGNMGTITNSYCSGTVSAGDYSIVAGFIAYDIGTSTNCYTTSTVTVGADGISGGFSAFSEEVEPVTTACFWSIESAGQETSLKGTVATNAQMGIKTIYSDAGWDFVDDTTNGTDDNWVMIAGSCPRLKFEAFGDSNHYVADLNLDGNIDSDDILIFAGYWLQESDSLFADTNNDGKVDILDLVNGIAANSKQ